MNKRVLISLVAALLLIAVLTPAIFAAPFLDTVVGENEVVNNDVVVFDGDLEVQEGAVVNGDVAVFNGDAFIDGRINGSITLFNGDLVTGIGAEISGQCVLLNGEVTGDYVAESRSRNSCTAIQSLELAPLAGLAPGMFRNFENPPEIAPHRDLDLEWQTIPAVPEMPEMPEMPVMPSVPMIPRVPGPESSSRNVGAELFGILSSSLLAGFLALLAAAIMPNQLRQIVTTAREKSLVSGMAGALTAVAVPSLIVLLIPVSIILTFVCIGLLGFPIMFLLGLGLVAGTVLGWLAVGTWLGLRLFGRGKEERLVRSAALGTGLLTFVVQMIGLMTFGVGGAVLWFIVSCIGLGAVALTQFGMKPFPRRPTSNTPGNSPDPDKVDNVLGTLPPEEIVI